MISQQLLWCDSMVIKAKQERISHTVRIHVCDHVSELDNSLCYEENRENTAQKMKRPPMFVTNKTNGRGILTAGQT